MVRMHTYDGYKVTIRESQTPPVAVFDPRYPRDPALYKTTSLDLAMRWIAAYRMGEAWAVSAKLTGEKTKMTVPKLETRRRLLDSLKKVEALLDLVRDVAGLSDSWLMNANQRDLILLLNEYRTKARAALDLTEKTK